MQVYRLQFTKTIGGRGGGPVPGNTRPRYCQYLNFTAVITFVNCAGWRGGLASTHDPAGRGVRSSGASIRRGGGGRVVPVSGKRRGPSSRGSHRRSGRRKGANTMAGQPASAGAAGV